MIGFFIAMLRSEKRAKNESTELQLKLELANKQCAEAELRYGHKKRSRKSVRRAMRVSCDNFEQQKIVWLSISKKIAVE
ncbi:MAG: hypothetical protein R3E61_08665 [Pseudomonadales bacterium]